MIKFILDDKQKRLDDFRPIIVKKICREFDYLISEYKKAYNTDKFDKYDLYDFSWKCPGRLKIKNFPRNAFFSSYKLYIKTKEKIH